MIKNKLKLNIITKKGTFSDEVIDVVIYPDGDKITHTYVSWMCAPTETCGYKTYYNCYDKPISIMIEKLEEKQNEKENFIQ